MKPITMAIAALMPTLAFAQDPNALFVSGKYQQVVEATAGTSDPAMLYLGARSYEKLGRAEEAKRTYSELARRSAGDPWRSVGESGYLLVQGNADGAYASARRAVALASALSVAYYQLGLASGHKEDFAAAAAAFARAAEIDPSSAYAHYHAGLSYYRMKRIDRMATHFEAFLRLAPKAPERGEVESIMRTVRGR